MEGNLSSCRPAGLRLWLTIGVLLLTTVQVGSLFPSLRGQVPILVAQVAAAPQIPAGPYDTVPSATRTSSLEEIMVAIHDAEILVLELGLATTNGAPIESLEWLVAYFQRGWALDMARELAGYYSYFDGTHHYLRSTDDVLPPLLVATTVTVKGVTERAAVVEAEFPAVFGPFQSPASTRSYFLIKEVGIWKIESITLSDTPSGMPRTDV